MTRTAVTKGVEPAVPDRAEIAQQLNALETRLTELVGDGTHVSQWDKGRTDAFMAAAHDYLDLVLLDMKVNGPDPILPSLTADQKQAIRDRVEKIFEK